MGMVGKAGSVEDYIIGKIDRLHHINGSTYALAWSADTSAVHWIP